MEHFKEILGGIIDLIYPGELYCLYCRTPLEKVNVYELCGYCMSLLPFIGENVCKKCGRPYELLEDERLCVHCRDEDVYYDECSSVFEFSGIVQGMLHKLKYGGEVELAHTAGMFISKKLEKTGWDIGAVIPVPLHEKRLSERGFNQSALIAGVVGREWGVDVLENALIRKRNTESQVNLSRPERLRNMEGAFEAAPSIMIPGRTFLLLDDIMTTGATLNECSKALKKYGAEKVYCITAATPAAGPWGIK